MKEYSESQRKKLIAFFPEGAAPCNGSESNRCSYIAACLLMGTTEVNGDDETSVFPEGSEEVMMEMLLIENYYLYQYNNGRTRKELQMVFRRST